MKKITFLMLLGILMITSCKKNEMSTQDDDTIEIPTTTSTVQWSKRTTISRPIAFQHAYQLSDGSYVAFSRVATQPYIVKFSPTGDTTLAKTLTELDLIKYENFEWFRLMKDENFLLFDFNKMKKTDQEFNLIWEVDFGQDPDYQANQFLVTADNGFLLQRPGSKIAKYNDNGIFEWEALIEEASDNTIMEIIQTTDLGYILLVSAYNSLAVGKIIKVNSNGEFQWKKEGFPFTAALHPTSDNGAVIMMELWDRPTGCNFGHVLDVVKVDQNGDFVWEQRNTFDQCAYHVEQEIIDFNDYYILGYILTQTYALGGEHKAELVTRTIDAATGQILEKINHGTIRAVLVGGNTNKHISIGKTTDGYFTVKSKYIDEIVSDVVIENVKVE